jgi:hypothetical protein
VYSKLDCFNIVLELVLFREKILEGNIFMGSDFHMMYVRE